ncbi:MAG: hypothetical protein ACE5IQ_04750 [Candidatus Methylomirabilales bacterium]
MPELDELIQVDADNIQNSRRILLTGLDPEFSRALDTAAGMFTAFRRCMEGALDDSADMATLAACARELKIDQDTLLVRIDSEAQDPVLNQGRLAIQSGLARRARGILFLLLQRQFMFGATDLLRMRIVSATGYCRQEAESLALLFLMRDDPPFANRWFGLTTDIEGIRFHREVQPRIREVLEQLDLTGAYERGSAASMHVRFESAILGLVLDRQPNEVLLRYQDVREDDPFSYFVEVFFFLATQVRVFRALGDAFPEVTDPIWPGRVRAFMRAYEYLRDRLERAFPERCEQYRQMIGEAR